MTLEYRLPIKGWSATDYSILADTRLGVVSDDQNFWEFATKERMDIFKKLINYDSE
jgi:hypothetical protein